MPDYALKASVMEEGIDQYQNSLSKKMFLAMKKDDEDRLIELEQLWNDAAEKFGSKWIEARKINSASNQRKYRLWNRIYAMLICHKCIFVTLTFTDEVLSNSTFESRRRYVREYLKQQSDYYVANIDFGFENEREHYHAIVMSDWVNQEDWKYGFTWVNEIRGSGDNVNVDDLERTAKKLSGYVNKLTNHAIKDTTKRNHIIYGRGKMNVLLAEASSRIRELFKKNVENIN